MSSIDGSSSRSASNSPRPPTKRKRGRSATVSDSASTASRSRSPPRRRRRSRTPSVKDASLAMKDQEDKEKLAVTEAKGEVLRGELAKLAPTRAGGAYIPPARLRALMAEAAAADPSSTEFQRMSWDALKKSITGLINKVAADNIKHIVPELFAGANLIRGRGLL